MVQKHAHKRYFNLRLWLLDSKGGVVEVPSSMHSVKEQLFDLLLHFKSIPVLPTTLVFPNEMN